MSGSSVYPIAVLAPPSLVVICACIEAVILASLHFLAVLTLVLQGNLLPLWLLPVQQSSTIPDELQMSQRKERRLRCCM